MVHPARKRSQTSTKFQSRGLWQAFFEVGQSVLHHNFSPRWRFNRLFAFFHIGKTFRVQVLGERQMGVPYNTRQGLEIVDIKSGFCALHQNFIQERFDGFSLCFFNIVTCQIGETSRHHVPCRDRLFRIKPSRRCSKRVNAQRQALASKRCPNPHFTRIKKSASPSGITVLVLQLIGVDAQRQPSKVALGVNDEGRDASQCRFFDQGFRHHRLSRSRRSEHGTVASQHLRSNVHRLSSVTPSPQQQPAWFVLLGLVGGFGEEVGHKATHSCIIG